MKRRDFIQQSCIIGAGTLLPSSSTFSNAKNNVFQLKLSVAQWSLHRQIRSGKLNTLEFPEKVKKKFGINAVEYVNQFFMDRAEDKQFLKSLKTRTQDNGIQSLLIMVDGEGSLASPEKKTRVKAVERHYKWVKAAQFLGCHSIRVNLSGEADIGAWHNASVESLIQLTNFSKDYGINIIVENHGGYSSNGKYLSKVIQQVKKSNCGTLPDFGNFSDYDRYLGMSELMPYAKGVSAKSYQFDKNGNETTIDYSRMLSIVGANKYQGYIGIEYEGNDDNEDKGILDTKLLLEKVVKNQFI